MGGVDGLTRYDGVGFRDFKSKTDDSATLCDNEVITLLSTKANALWVGTVHGLCKYDPEKDLFVRFRKGALASAYIYCLHEDKDQNLWVGTNCGLFRGDNRHPGEFTPIIRSAGDTISPVIIRSVYEDSRGRIWAGSSKGLILVKPTKGGYQFTLYQGPKNGVTSILEDPHNPAAIWAGTRDAGIVSFDINTAAIHTVLSAGGANAGLPRNDVSVIYPAADGHLWIGTSEGLSIYDPVSGRSSIFQHDFGESSSLSQNTICSIFKDDEGSIWVGTYYGGANVSYSHSTHFRLYHGDPNRPSISNDVVSCFATDSMHNLWIGTDGGGLDYFDRRSSKFISFQHSETDPNSIADHVVKSLCIDRDGNIWIGTHAGGLNLKQGNRFLRVLKDSLVTEVESLLEDRVGRFWVGSADRLRVYTRKGRILVPCAAITNLASFNPSADVHVIFEDKENNIWIGSGDKLFVLKKGQTRLLQFPSGSDSLLSRRINCICEDRKGRLWFGANTGGLVVYDPANGQTRNYDEKQGSQENTVEGICEDDNGWLWLSTDVGLSCLDPNSNRIRNFGESDGLPRGGFFNNSVFKDRNGQLFFGGYNGFVSFIPAAIDLNPNVPALLFTSLDVLNKPVSIGANDGLLHRSMVYQDHISLGYDQDHVTIHFALLNFIKPEKNRYAYRMEGIDQDWNVGPTTFAMYTRLPAGNYAFKVKAANNDGVWSKPIFLNITIRPPFWRTWWAYCIYGLLAVALVFFFMRYLLLRERLKQENALHKAKLDFFTNISHEIRTHLALISGPVEKMLFKKRDEEDQQQLQYIKRNSESLFQLVRELMDFRKAEAGHLTMQVSHGDLVAFTREIFQRFDTVAGDRNILASFLSTAESVHISFDAEQMEKVLINLLTNAFKFTPDGGTVDVLMEEKRSAVEIRVVDNGKGIARENLPKLFTNYFQEIEYGMRNTGYGIGLALAKTIVELHKGRLEVESTPGVLTCFTVTLPKKGLSVSSQAPEPRESLLEWPELSSVVQNVEGERKYSVLIVEDNSDLRSFLRSALDDKYLGLEATNGLEGWEIATEEIPDLIITDVMMPGMDGFRFCGKLKKDPRTSHIPIVLLTARSSTADQISGLELGADVYLAKPFSIHILRLHLRNLLAARELLRQRYAGEIALPSGQVAETTIDDQFMKKALSYIDEKMDDPEFGVAMLSTHMLMSQPILYKKVKALTGMSVNEFIKSVRLKKAAQLLLKKKYTVYEVVYMVGYSDRKHFTREFKKLFDVTPGEYGKASKQMKDQSALH
jgi:ligand-binding sensor domain-containing protein/signal transduction histidine kinase/DNA-binding response OmpR family regulator